CACVNWLLPRSDGRQTRIPGRRARGARHASSALPQCLDEIPLPHLRTTRDVPPLGLVVELLPRAVFQPTTGFAASCPSTSGLPAHILPNRGGKMRDRPLPLRCCPCLLDVPPRPRRLLPRRPLHPLLVPPRRPFPLGRRRKRVRRGQPGTRTRVRAPPDRVCPTWR